MKIKKMVGNLLMGIMMITSFVSTGYLMYFWADIVYTALCTRYTLSAPAIEWIVMIWLTILSIAASWIYLNDIIDWVRSKMGKWVAA